MTKVSVNDLIKQKRQSFNDKKVGGKNAYKFKGGTTTIRILPGWRNGDPVFFHEFGQTFIKNQDKEMLAVVGDRQITFGEQDPVRDLIQRAKGEARSDVEREFYHDMLAKPRVLVNALVLNDKEVDPTVPQLVEFSETQFDNILKQIDMNEIGDEFLDLEKGFNLKVNKTGSSFKDIRYDFAFDRKPSSVDKSVMENLVDIDAYVRAKFQDSDRAVNAIKSVTQGIATPKAISYSGDNTDAIDADYSVIEDAKTPVSTEDETEVTKRSATSAEIDSMFDEE